MDSSLLAENEVYIGVWINKSLGKFQAATITVDQRWWNIMVSFVSLFVAATARSVWKLVRFMLHFHASVAHAEDGIHHQRQAVLRNTVLATDAALQLLQIGHVWRRRARKSRTRLAIFCIVAVTVSLSTTAASFFSSQLLDRSSREVLIKGRDCGRLPYGYIDSNLTDTAKAMAYNARKIKEDFLYASQCYNGSSTQDCERFVQPALPFHSDYNATCPFAPEMCKAASGNIYLDTGSLDSVTYLGLNGGPRFTLRYTTHCAPIVTEGFITFIKPHSGSNQTYVAYNYGMEDHNSDNKTLMPVHFFDAGNLQSTGPTAGGNYKLSSVEEPDMAFIPQLTRGDALVSLVFLDASKIIYDKKTEDPWFSATRTVEILDDKGKNITRYVADRSVSVLGCASQRFLCNPRMPESACINTLSRRKSVRAIQKSWPEPKDQHQIYPLLAASYMHSLGKGTPDSLYSMSTAPTLLARNTLWREHQTAYFPPDHWKSERRYLFTGSLAAWQSSLVNYARGAWYGHSSCKEDFPCERVCYSQRVKSSDFHSFSAWTLFTILLAGTLIMLLAFFLEDLCTLLLRKTSLMHNQRVRYAHAEWQAGSTLQLQRIAHENLQLGTWEKTDSTVPVTRPNETLGVYDTRNLEHVQLVGPPGMARKLNVWKPSVGAHDGSDGCGSASAVDYAGGDIADGGFPASGIARTRTQYLRLASSDHASVETL